MTSESKLSVLFLLRSAPFASSMATAGTDIILSSAIFDQEVTLVFADDGVFQLLNEQDSSGLGIKSPSQVFPALELYGVNKVLVEQTALQSRGLSKEDLLMPVELINDNKLSDLLELADQVFCF